MSFGIKLNCIIQSLNPTQEAHVDYTKAYFVKITPIKPCFFKSRVRVDMCITLEVKANMDTSPD
ncbi:hypothetical protein A0J61_04780 [Choanephora cucurbitarum]|uniref:Uncharacterized protein n=1 Tax=Choanephora cucurbitarum TaxID=101091 RepID=A0A1C7NF38_9FUNG|nr:hypothetical protein A0J61_04780 [Choanephora cucurbitarum]